MNRPHHQPFVGMGLRQPHYREVLETQPAIDFLEVHSENFFAPGGAARATLLQARAHYPISLHGVGLALGSVQAPHVMQHIQTLAELVKQVDPLFVSEHLCWGSSAQQHFHDLLPMPLTDASLNLLCERVDHLQHHLQRTVLIENISAYLQFAQADYTEMGFLAALAQRTGCKLLLDLNNLYVNACNFGLDAAKQLSELPPHCVAEIHIAGHTVQEDLRIDTHSTPVCEAVWQLYQYALTVFGCVPTLVEWDNHIPPLPILLGEMRTAQTLQKNYLSLATQAMQPMNYHAS